MTKSEQLKIFESEKAAIQMFLMEKTRPEKGSIAYLGDLFAMYRGWRRVNLMGPSKISVSSFARAMPTKYERKLLNRGRKTKGLNPARAVIGLSAH